MISTTPRAVPAAGTAGDAHRLNRDHAGAAIARAVLQQRALPGGCSLRGKGSYDTFTMGAVLRRLFDSPLLHRRPVAAGVDTPIPGRAAGRCRGEMSSLLARGGGSDER